MLGVESRFDTLTYFILKTQRGRPDLVYEALVYAIFDEILVAGGPYKDFLAHWLLWGPAFMPRRDLPFRARIRSPGLRVPSV
jgi:hypothetical protein